MAIAEFAEPIYKLIDELGIGAEEAVLDDLIRWLSDDTIKDFVEDYRRHHNMVEEDDDSLDDIGFEDYHLCMDCQESYDINKRHVCPDEKTEIIDRKAEFHCERSGDWDPYDASGMTSYFSARIPEC